jgi:hypothetical protein
MDASEVSDMARAYVTAALFTADEDIVSPMSGEFDPTPYIRRVPQAYFNLAECVCRAFYEQNAADLASYPAENAGHDLWYTRNGHGVGFWEADHCSKEEGERLTAAAHKLGEAYVEGGRWITIGV